MSAEARRITWTVNGVVREALVCAPVDKNQPAPLVFVFHGHGGSMANALRSFHLETLWPQAIVVYPQGLPTVGQLTDPEGKKAGWQAGPGDYADRDLKFFDAMLAGLRKQFKVDERRIYATGHSNGGGFTYLLLGQRGALFAAVAPSSAVARPDKQGAFAPRPVLHIGGRNDALVKFSWQEMGIEYLRRQRGCGPGQSLPNGIINYPAPDQQDVATFFHTGTHKFSAEAPALIVAFIKMHALPNARMAAEGVSPQKTSASLKSSQGGGLSVISN